MSTTTKFSKKKGWFILILLLMTGAGCQHNEDEFLDYQAQDRLNGDIASFRSPTQCVEFLDGLFAEQLKYGTSPVESNFDSEFYEEYMDEFELQDMAMQQTGFVAYVNDLVTDELILSETQDLLLFAHQSVNDEQYEYVSDLRDELISTYHPDVVEVYDPLYCYIYSIVLEVYNQYYSTTQGEGSFRHHCPFQEFVQHVIEAAAQGVRLGDIVGQWIGDVVFFELEVFGVTIEVTSEVIGGAIGAVIGLFTYEDDCDDCVGVANVRVRSSSNCGLTRTIEAVGAGEAAAYEWHIHQNGQIVIFTTTDNMLTVTQASNNTPLDVYVFSLCNDGGVAEMMEMQRIPFSIEDIEQDWVEVDLNTIGGNSPLAQPGDISIMAGPIMIQPDPVNCISAEFVSEENATNTIFWLNSNVGSGHIDQSFSISPPGLGTVLSSTDNSVRIKWNQAGCGQFVVDAENMCSNLTSTATLRIEILND